VALDCQACEKLQLRSTPPLAVANTHRLFTAIEGQRRMEKRKSLVY
jgi:hypothetical protein